jgi:4-diphosphocytidyl-2-C-methyl-D-erythritol kinase
MLNVKAYAKINLGLQIVGKRSDGFHNIETVFHRINLYDEITLGAYETISLSVNSPAIPQDKENLCWKAAELLQQEFQTKQGAHIRINKNIPVGAGLGGGSSDAAAVLQTLPKLWNKNAEQSLLHTLAIRIGSDVPFFLGHQSAYAEGRGEKLSYLHVELPYWIVVVNPGIHVSTAWAYNTVFRKRNGIFPHRTTLKNMCSLPPAQWLPAITNDFEEIVFEAYPEIGKIKTKLLALKAVSALLSGSGSSVFGFFEDEADVAHAVKIFEKDYFVNVTEPHFTIG